MRNLNLNISTTPVIANIQSINATVTEEMIDDLKNMDFYVSKSLIPLMNNNVITIEECTHKKFYRVKINNLLSQRFFKLHKLTNNKKLKEIMDIVQVCLDNRKGWWEVAEDELTDELTESINKDILKKLKEYGEQNHNSHGKFNI